MPEETKKTSKISGKDATIIAINYFREITGITSGVMVEELELIDGGKFWSVTLGYIDQTTIGVQYISEPKKSFKTLKVNSSTKEVVSIKIRNQFI